MHARIAELPPIYDPDQVGQVRFVKYADIEAAAASWAVRNNIPHFSTDQEKNCLLLVDEQITFCNETCGELPVAGAEASSRRLVEFIGHELKNLTSIAATLDTQQRIQIFSPCFLVDANGQHPTPGIPIPLDDIEHGKWSINPAIAHAIVGENGLSFMEQHLRHYAGKLASSDKLALMPWPYHAQLTGIGDALEPSIEEMTFFWGVCRGTQLRPETKGLHPLVEMYSVMCPEVTTTLGMDGKEIPLGEAASRNVKFLEMIVKHDRIIIAGQAKSHCVAWTIADMLGWLYQKDPKLINKVYLLEDCTDPVIIPGVIDFTDMANAQFEKFRQQGCHIVKSTTPMSEWN